MTSLFRRRKVGARWLAIAALAVVLAVVGAAATASIWKPVAKRSRWFVVATNMYQDLLRRTHLRADQIGQGEGLARTADEIPRTIDTINRTFDAYLHYSGLTAADLRGRRVLELGPGDNIGVPLRFAAAGAPFVSTIDKFVPLQDDGYHRDLYKALRATLTPDQQRHFDRAIDLEARVAPRDEQLQYIYGRGFEEESTYQAQSFDLVVSNAVLEEIYDIDQAFAAMDRVLRPGGYLLHKIDLRDYGMFTKHGFHPLEYLTVSDPVYQHMVESSGQPNRRLVDYYKTKSESLGYDTTIYVSWVLGNAKEIIPHKTTLTRGIDYTDRTLELIREIRPRLQPRYRKLSDEELMVQGIYFVARKPATAHGS